MSRYSFVIVLVLSFFAIGCSAKSVELKDIKKVSTKIPDDKPLDFYYMVAVDCQIRAKDGCSALMYEKLYQKTKQKEFLKSMVKEAFVAKRYDIYNKYVSDIKVLAKSDTKIATLLLPYYLNKKDYKSAENLAKSILKKQKSVKNYQLMSAIYIDTGRYAKAEKVLREYIDGFGCNEEICNLLLLVKTRQNDAKGMIKILKRLYAVTKDKSYEVQLVKAYAYAKEYDELEKYVDSNPDIPKEVLLELFNSLKEFDRVERISYELYQKTKDPYFLANSAVFLYEAKYKKDPKILDTVLKRFEKSIDKIEDAMFYNYYGYILIDHDKDIKKGIKYVKKALKIEPNSEYYLDSLAWGYYKEGRCKEAFAILYDLKDKEQEEIKMHIKKVKECIKR